MINLLDETEEVLQDNGKTWDDVKWIGTIEGTHSIGKDDFVRLANFFYHEGYGWAEVLTNLVIVGDDWWLERGEYDGSEWWRFQTRPQLAAKVEQLTALKEERY